MLFMLTNQTSTKGSALAIHFLNRISSLSTDLGKKKYRNVAKNITNSILSSKFGIGFDSLLHANFFFAHTATKNHIGVNSGL